MLHTISFGACFMSRATFLCHVTFYFKQSTFHIKYELVRIRYELHCHSLHTPGHKPKISKVIKMRSAASEIKHVVTPSPYYVFI
jgi:hypothetical protein